MTTHADETTSDTTADTSNWTNWLRTKIVGLVPPGQALPDRQPVYVASWIYVFGVLTLASLVVVIGSGCVLAIGGSAWWHVSSLGHYVNSVHLWSVELLFGFMVIHLWGKFFMAAWRGERSLTWISGVVLFAVSIGTSFTGFLAQTNFDAQWIGGQAKDGLNSVGVGAWTDADVAHRPAAAGRGRSDGDARDPGPAPRCRAADRRSAGALSNDLEVAAARTATGQHPGHA